MRQRVAILVFPDVEVLDFAGPFEVFAVADELSGYELFEVTVVGPTLEPLRAKNGLQVIPDRALSGDADDYLPHVLVIPGGDGSRAAMDNAQLIGWVREVATHAEIVMTVCTGTRIAGAAGLLDGREYTTHRRAAPGVAELFPAATQRLDRRVVDTGPFVSTGGISAGLDGAFHVLRRLAGDGVAKDTADYMEYTPVPVTGGPMS
jgi:transcriptional regulator GlxA family with amidase domain